METREMRAVYAETLLELAKNDGNIVVLEADLMRANGTGLFAKEYPKRTFNVGVAEANMVGVAAGLSSVGKIPFAATFGSFAGRRDYDQFFISANYARLNVKLVGTDPGVLAKYNGGTHMPFEDLALMRMIPDLTVLEPSDPVSLAGLIRVAARTYGCAYIRLQRTAAPVLYEPSEPFEVGKAKELRRGDDVTLLALGSLMVGEALKAAEALGREEIGAAVWDMLSLKPLDEEAVLRQARKTGCLVTCENGQRSGGLGSAVAETLMDARVVASLARVGVRDEFGEVGTVEYLQERFGLTAGDIVRAVRELLNRR